MAGRWVVVDSEGGPRIVRFFVGVSWYSSPGASGYSTSLKSIPSVLRHPGNGTAEFSCLIPVPSGLHEAQTLLSPLGALQECRGLSRVAVGRGVEVG